MIRRLSDMEIDFTLAVHAPMCKWGDDPDLDQTGATLHLSETYSVTHHDAYKWIRENGLSFTTEVNYDSRVMRLRFTHVEDAMAFKLKWL